MRRTIFSVLGAALAAASLMQTAVAAGHRHGRSADRAPASARQPSRDAGNVAASSSLAQQDYEYWQGRGRSALAGH